MKKLYQNIKKALTLAAASAFLYGSAVVGNENAKNYAVSNSTPTPKTENVELEIEKRINELEKMVDSYNKSVEQYNFLAAESSETLTEFEKTLDETGEFNEYISSCVLKMTEDTADTLKEYRELKEKEK